jgi:Helix-turn-helix domain
VNDPLALLTAAEVAVLFGRSRSFVFRLIREGRLPIVNLDGPPKKPGTAGRKNYRCRRCDVEAFIDAVTTRVAQPPRPALPVPRGRLVVGDGGIILSDGRSKPKPAVAGWWDGVDRLRKGKRGFIPEE